MVVDLLGALAESLRKAKEEREHSHWVAETQLSKDASDHRSFVSVEDWEVWLRDFAPDIAYDSFFMDRIDYKQRGTGYRWSSLKRVPGRA